MKELPFVCPVHMLCPSGTISQYLLVRFDSFLKEEQKKPSSCYVIRTIFSRLLFTASFIEKLILIKSLKGHLRQLLQTVPTSNMLQVPLRLDALFEHFNESANKPSPRCQSKSYNAPRLFKYTSDGWLVQI